jgi:hypothetical protein
LVGLTDNYLELSYLVTFDSIDGGSNYQFRIRAENSEGFSQTWSPVVTITANAIPDQVHIPVTEVYQNTNVKIRWDYPSDNYSPLVQFEILLQGSDGKWYTHPNCNGQDTTVTNCVVSMLSLRQSKFLLAQNDVVIAKVRAQNSINWGAFSQPNIDGAHIIVEPYQMQPPYRGYDTSESNL